MVNRRCFPDTSSIDVTVRLRIEETIFLAVINDWASVSALFRLSEMDSVISLSGRCGTRAKKFDLVSRVTCYKFKYCARGNHNAPS